MSGLSRIGATHLCNPPHLVMTITQLPTNKLPVHASTHPTPIVAGCGINGANTLRGADLVVRQHVMDTCTRKNHLDRGRVQKHFTPDPRNLSESEDPFQGQFRLRDDDDGNTQEKKDSSASILRRADLPGFRGNRVAGVNAKAVQSAPKTSLVGLISALQLPDSITAPRGCC